MGTRTDTIQQEIDETRESITEKMETIEAKVQYTADEVRDSVSNTVENIKERFNVDQMVRERPWAMLGASIVAGYVLGSFGGSSRNDDYRSRDYRSYEDDDDDNTYYRGRPYRYYTAETMRRSGSGSRSNRSSAIMNELSNQMGKEMDALKEATIVTITKTLRSTLRETVPQLADEFERARAEREYQHQEDNSSSSNHNTNANSQ